MAIKLTPAGAAIVYGTMSPLLSAQGQFLEADLTPSEGRAALAGRFPQTTRWPLPGSGELHELDTITILGVQLPLAGMPEGADELDVSERKEPGSDYSTFVSHGKKSSPVRITVLLFRDQSLGWRGGTPAGKDWFLEWDKVWDRLIAKRLSKRDAVPVYYPTLHRRGVDSLIFTRVGDPRLLRGAFYTVDLEGRDPRTVRLGGGSKKVVQAEDVYTNKNPLPVPPHKAAAKSGAKPSTKQRGKA